MNISAHSVTPSDTENLSFPTTAHAAWGRSIFIGTPGDVALWLVDQPRMPENAQATVFKNCPVGWLNVPAFKRVMATGTTAGELKVREAETPDGNEVTPAPGHTYVRTVRERQFCETCKRPFPLA